VAATGVRVHGSGHRRGRSLARSTIGVRAASGLAAGARPPACTCAAAGTASGLAAGAQGVATGAPARSRGPRGWRETLGHRRARGQRACGEGAGRSHRRPPEMERSGHRRGRSLTQIERRDKREQEKEWRAGREEG